MPSLAVISAAEADWVRRFNFELKEAVEMRNHIHSKFIEYLECTPDELTITGVNEAEYVEAANQLQFFERESLIRSNEGFWFAPMTLEAGLATLFLRIDFRDLEGRFSIRDEAFDAEVIGPSDETLALVETFFARLTTRIVETTRLPTWQKNIKQRTFKGFQL